MSVTRDALRELACRGAESLLVTVRPPGAGARVQAVLVGVEFRTRRASVVASDRELHVVGRPFPAAASRRDVRGAAPTPEAAA